MWHSKRGDSDVHFRQTEAEKYSLMLTVGSWKVKKRKLKETERLIRSTGEPRKKEIQLGEVDHVTMIQKTCITVPYYHCLYIGLSYQEAHSSI